MRISLQRAVVTGVAIGVLGAASTASAVVAQAPPSSGQRPATVEGVPVACETLGEPGRAEAPPRGDPQTKTHGPATRNDGRRTMRRFLPNLLRGTVGVYSTDNIKPLLVGSAATGIGALYDDDVADWIADPAHNFGNSLESGAAPAVVGGAIAVLFATGRAVGAPRYRAMTYDWLHAFLINAGYTTIVKAAVHRDRPNGEDNLSFPSGHASNAFTLAAVAERHYGWKAGLPAYTLAGLVAVSRLQRNKHYLSDVMAGATLGYLVGRTVVRVNGQPLDASRRPQLSLSPVITRHSCAVVAGITF